MSKDLLCTAGYAAKMRHVSIATKNQVILRYVAEDRQFALCWRKGECEVDHLIPLELGGSNSLENLWPEMYCPLHADNCLGAREKDVVETYLHRQVCRGAMSLLDAQKAIVKNWIELYIDLKKNR